MLGGHLVTSKGQPTTMCVKVNRMFGEPPFSSGTMRHEGSPILADTT